MIKMTKEQKAMFNSLTSLQQEIALNSLSGMNDIDSYKASSGKATTDTAMRTSVGQILTNRDVALFIDSMKEVSVNDAVMSRSRMLELQTKIANIGNKEIDLMSLESLNELKGALDVKLKAMNQLADLAGYKSASKLDLTSLGKSMAPKDPTDLTDEELAKIIDGK